MKFNRILVVGYGTMTGAMVEGWLAAGRSADQFEVYHPTRTEVERGLVVHNSFPQTPYDAVLLGVKPHMLDEVAPGLEPVLGPETVLLTVLAGIEIDSYRQRFPRARAIVRFMPNLAVALRKSPNGLFAGDIDARTRAAISALAEEVGTAEWLDDESQFDLLTALAGSGPGFVYRFIDALASGAADLGLEPQQAERLAVAMVEGAAALASASEHSPHELARRVASPGGMTQKGLDVLDDGNALNLLVKACLKAARDRGGEMAAAIRKDG